MFIGLLSMNATPAGAKPPAYPDACLDTLALEIAPGENRPYVHSGYGNAFFYGSTGTEAGDGHMGFYAGEPKLFRDFQVFADGRRLDRAQARVTYYPDRLAVAWDGGVRLEIIPLYPDRHYLRFRLTGAPPSVFDFFLTLEQPEEKTEMRGDLISVRTVRAQDTLWYGLAAADGFAFPPHEESAASEALQPYLAMVRNGEALRGRVAGDGFDLVFLYALTREAMTTAWDAVKADPEAGRRSRRAWLLEEINRAYFHCANEEINRAVNWVKISLAQLWAEDETALWAGYPWFNDCWGRDTFISLAGACLVQGKFAQAKALLERFAKWQNRDPASPDYGRIPNRARFGDIGYNTADGTPWFVRGVYDYGLYSGDFALWRDYLADSGAVRIAMDGTLQHHTDSLGFLVHGEAETWMDAVGVDGPWSPRGDRAVEIQALLRDQLLRTGEMAWHFPELRQSPEVSPLSQHWQKAAGRLQASFHKYFIRPDGLGLYDHLNRDGTPDSQIRPNQLFALTIAPSLLTGEEGLRERIIATVRDSLVYPWGVASLAQTDREFHPYHQYPLYPRDAAYHNGVVWTWLSGPYKNAAKSGWVITKSEMDQVLRRGAPGTLPELLDAVPKAGEAFPRPAGTVSQAWSLAEFLRAWYQDYLGLQPVRATAVKTANAWELIPVLPRDWGDFQVRLQLRDTPVLFSAAIQDDSVRFRFQSEAPLSAPIRLALFAPWSHVGVGEGMEIVLSDGSPEEVTFPREGDWIEYVSPAGNLPARTLRYRLFLPEESPDDYLQPQIAADLKALQPPAHWLLTGPEIKAENSHATVLVDADDPAGDDTGDGGYTYPTGPHFRPGILDLTHVRVTYDSTSVYFRLAFRDLVQPGWRPEYGFQLTFATIAINTGCTDVIHREAVGRNSGWTLPREYAADRFVHVGGGLRVENENGDVLAEFIPSGTEFPLGDAAHKEVSFALPRDLLPCPPEMWRLAVLVGAQDDHGGGGLGEFREVAEKAGSWTGGGGGPGKPNVYDWFYHPGK